MWRRCTPCALGTHPRLVTIVRLAAVPRLTAQQSGTLGITFDRRLDDAWAELEALNTFVGYASDLEIRLPPSGADIRIRRKTSGRTILVEVNREAV